MLSIFTPHWEKTNPYILDCYRSISHESNASVPWEWIICVNNGGVVPKEITDDPRVFVFHYSKEAPDQGIGAYKRAACEQARGSVLVEIDADDLITPGALPLITDAFVDEKVGFAYSNAARFFDKTWEPRTFSSYWGWTQRPFVYEGHKLVEMISFPVTPQAMRAIYWSPNHIRAWRTRLYWEIGGHPLDLPVIDDYDLLCRTYLSGTEMYHIDACLYLYRNHADQTTRTDNATIQKLNRSMYTKYIMRMAQEWCRRNGYPMLDLGAAHGKPHGYTGLDLHGTDITCDLREGIPYEDSSVGIIRAYDVLEHLPDPIATMNEIWRVLVPGGWLLVSVPSTDGRGAFQAPDHVSFWNENSFLYYTDPRYARYLSNLRCQFQKSRVITWFPDEARKKLNISYVDAQLIALKPGYFDPGECPGENLWRAKPTIS